VAVKSAIVLVVPGKETTFDYWDKGTEKPATFTYRHSPRLRLYASIKNAANAIRGLRDVHMFELFWDEEKQQLFHVSSGSEVKISEVKR
jgi:hypothetical protein